MLPLLVATARAGVVLVAPTPTPAKLGVLASLAIVLLSGSLLDPPAGSTRASTRLLRIEPAQDHLRYVLDNLWPRGVEEFERLGVTKEQAFDRFSGYIATGLRPIALVFDRPVVVTGIGTEGGEQFTWFIATDEFERHASAITRQIRREARHFDPLYIYSVCVHPDTEKWFRVLGFEKQDWRGTTAAGWPLFRFKRK
jgi:hypothetical protein